MTTKGPRIAVAVLLGLSLLVAGSLLLAPLMLEPGTVVGLDGRANALDYQEKWDRLPLYPKIVYYFGDFNCHQKSSRSFYLHGNQLPVCARDTGVFWGNVVGIVPLLFLPLSPFVGETMLGIFPRKLREKGMERPVFKWALIAGLAALSLVPLVIDGSYQLISQASVSIPDYESNNTMRLITGLMFGAFGGFWVGSMLAALFYIGNEPVDARITGTTEDKEERDD